MCVCVCEHVSIHIYKHTMEYYSAIEKNLNGEISEGFMKEVTFVMDLNSWLILNGVWYMRVRMGIGVCRYGSRYGNIP